MKIGIKKMFNKVIKIFLDKLKSEMAGLKKQLKQKMGQFEQKAKYHSWRGDNHNDNGQYKDIKSSLF